MIDDDLYEQERYLMEQLKLLHEAYLRDAKPIIDQLVRIRCLRPAPRVIFAPEMAKQLTPK